LESILRCCHRQEKNAKTVVNLSMVYAYYKIGRRIVEEEQCRIVIEKDI